MGQGQREDKKRKRMEETETGGKRKKIPFKERTGACGGGVRRTDNGGRMVDGVVLEGDRGPGTEGSDRGFIRQGGQY